MRELLGPWLASRKFALAFLVNWHDISEEVFEMEPMCDLEFCPALSSSHFFGVVASLLALIQYPRISG